MITVAIDTDNETTQAAGVKIWVTPVNLSCHALDSNSLNPAGYVKLAIIDPPQENSNA